MESLFVAYGCALALLCTRRPSNTRAQLPFRWRTASQHAVPPARGRGVADAVEVIDASNGCEVGGS